MNSDNSIMLSRLKNHLVENFGKSIVDVFLFGSQTQSFSKRNSDYDVLIILNKSYSGKDENIIIDFCYGIDLELDIVIDVHIISEKELKTLRGKQAIFANAIKSGVYA